MPTGQGGSFSKNFRTIFQVHGIDAAGQVVMRRQSKRRYAMVSSNCSVLPPILMISDCPKLHASVSLREEPSTASKADIRSSIR
jgi:hypothetical protein